MKIRLIIFDILFLLLTAAVFEGAFGMLRKDEMKRAGELADLAAGAAEAAFSQMVDSGMYALSGIYSNDDLYTFLGGSYSTTSDYVNAYDKAKRNRALPENKSTVIKGYTIYTGTPGITPNQQIRHFSDAAKEGWYDTWTRMNKALILYVDLVKDSVLIIRKLDYASLNGNGAVIVLELDDAAFKNNLDMLEYDGELYVLGEGSVIYSNTGKTYADGIDIGYGFHFKSGNYYTAEMIFAAYTPRIPVSDVIKENLFVIFAVIVIFAGINIFWLAYISDASRRIKALAEAAGAEYDGNASESPEKEIREKRFLDMGRGRKDEVGRAITIAAKIMERLDIKSRQYVYSQKFFAESEEKKLKILNEALALDAAVRLFRKNGLKREAAEKGLLKKEIKRETWALRTELERIGEPDGMEGISVGNLTDSLKDSDIPVFMITDAVSDLIQRGYDVDISAGNEDGVLVIKGIAAGDEDQDIILKLHAVFEDGNKDICDSFSVQDEFNPYIRIKNVYGSAASFEHYADGTVRIHIKLL